MDVLKLVVGIVSTFSTQKKGVIFAMENRVPEIYSELQELKNLMRQRINHQKWNNIIFKYVRDTEVQCRVLYTLNEE